MPQKALSIIIPSNRDALSSIYTALDLLVEFADQVDVVISYNGNSDRKRMLLRQLSFMYPNLKANNNAPDNASDNFLSGLMLSQSQFVLFLADDDIIFKDAIREVLRLINNSLVLTRGSVTSIIGDYFVSNYFGKDTIVRYTNISVADDKSRLGSFIYKQSPNFLFYSIVRTDLMKRILNFIKSIPFELSFRDQIHTLAQVATGNIVHLQRVIYGYDHSSWSIDSIASKRNLDSYVDSGLGSCVSNLHFVLQAVEGAYLLKSKFLESLCGKKDWGESESLWFQTKIAYFYKDKTNFCSGNDVCAICDRVRSLFHNRSLIPTADLALTQVSEIINMSKPGCGTKYSEFWINA